jgi:hypothetical protein
MISLLHGGKVVLDDAFEPAKKERSFLDPPSKFFHALEDGFAYLWNFSHL